MLYDPVKVFPKFLVPIDYWQGIGDLGGVWLVSIFSFLERFTLRLKILDQRVLIDVGSGDDSSGGLIVSYYVTHSEELLIGLFSEEEGWRWDF